jgi:hypothetical protein
MCYPKYQNVNNYALEKLLMWTNNIILVISIHDSFETSRHLV